MSERTLEQAMAHAKWIKQYDAPNYAEIDLMLLADEILRLRAEGWKEQALAILGANRDHMKPEDVAVIQNFIAGVVGVDTGVGKP